ncbi:MAG TPA: hypothetical protein DEO40_02425 [Treponema sp.]|nr:hypothetical protein [Treponema sp.]
MKRLGKIAGCAALALAAAAMMGCGGKTNKASNAAGGNDSTASDIIPKQTVTLQVYDQLANYSGEQVGWFGKIMLDKFNVKLNIIPESGNTYTTRMESGNLGDIVIWGNDSDDYLNAAEGGLLFDWEEEDLLTNYGPYIKDHMALALEKNRGISDTGKIYGFGHGVSTSSKDRQGFFYTWDLRYDLYEQLGKPAIKNYDDLHKVLKQMKEICPKDDNGQETYGVSLFPDWDGNMVMFVKSLATAYVGWDEFGFGLYNPVDGTYHSCLEENGPYLDALKFLNDLYQDGLLDPDSQTQTYDAMNENYVNGTAFWNIFNWMASGVYNTEAHNSAGKAMYSVRPEDASPICYGQSVFGGNRIWSIGSKTEYPELCMAIINWLCTPEGFMTSLYGPKGVTWDYDANGKTYFTELGKKCQSDSNTAMPAPYTGVYKDGTFQMNNITWANDATNPDSNGETYNKTSWASEATPAKFEIEQKWRDWAKASSVEEYLGNGKYVLAPSSTYSESAKTDELQATANQVATAIKTGSWKAMYAKNDAEFDKLVQAMISEAKSYGIDAVDAFYVQEAAKKKAAEDKAAGK